MMRWMKADNGMNIVGQGGRILLFTLPVAFGAVMVHCYAPEIARLPLPPEALAWLGGGLIGPGLVLWLTAVVQLLIGFPRGELIATGAYGVCRNPIYAANGLFVIPGISLLMGTWVYIVVGAALCVAVIMFIGKEERELLRVFGKQYADYTKRVGRILPFVGPIRWAARVGEAT